MDENLADLTSLQSGMPVAASLFVVLVLWILAKQLRFAQAFFSKHLWSAAFIDLVLFPASAYAIGLLVTRLLGAVGFENLQGVARVSSELLLFLALAYGVARLVEAWVLSKAQDGRRAQLSGIARSALYGVCFIFGLLAFVIANDYAPTELYVSTGALAALVAFAMQKTLGDLFSGIALSIEKPFEIGDWLRLDDGTEGEVVDINWRATRLRGWDKTTCVVANGHLSQGRFTNLHGRNHLFAPWYLLRVSGDADPLRVKALLEDAAARCETVLRDPAPVARLMDGATIPYTYMVWVHFENYPAMFAGREELYREIHYGLRAAGLKTAAEIREIHHRPVEGAAPERLGPE